MPVELCFRGLVKSTSGFMVNIRQDVVPLCPGLSDGSWGLPGLSRPCKAGLRLKLGHVQSQKRDSELHPRGARRGSWGSKPKNQGSAAGTKLWSPKEML